MTGFDQFIDQYGTLTGFILIVLFNWVLPFLRDKWWPARVQAEDEERKARIKALQEEREWHRQNEVERLEEMKKQTTTVQSMATGMLQIQGNINQIIANQGIIREKQDKTDSFLTNAVYAMRETVAAKEGKRAAKIKTGPLDPRKAKKAAE